MYNIGQYYAQTKLLYTIVLYELVLGWYFGFPRDRSSDGNFDVRRSLPRCGLQGKKSKSSFSRYRRVLRRRDGITAR